jgi:hypothetical protein
MISQGDHERLYTDMLCYVLIYYPNPRAAPARSYDYNDRERKNKPFNRLARIIQSHKFGSLTSYLVQETRTPWVGSLQKIVSSG